MTEQPHQPHTGEHGHAGEHTAHDAHHGSPFIQHHYDDAQHQFDSGKLGIWLFLAQEVLFFSALFVAYILYRVPPPGDLLVRAQVPRREVRRDQHRGADLLAASPRRGRCAARSSTSASGLIAVHRADDRLRVRVPRHQVHRVLAQGPRAHPVRPLLRSVRQLGRPRAADPQQQLPGHQVDRGVGLRRRHPDRPAASADIDQDPRAEGVQADCAVKEYEAVRPAPTPGQARRRPPVARTS